MLYKTNKPTFYTFFKRIWLVQNMVWQFSNLRPSPKWFNPRIKLLTKRKFKLHCLVRSSPHCPVLKLLYVESCKQVKFAVRSSIRRFEESIVRASKREPKLLFNYINSQRVCRGSIKGLTDSEGVFHTDGSAQIAVSSLQPAVNYDIFSPTNILKYIERLNSSKSPGMDGVHPFVVKSCASSFAEIFSRIFLSSFPSGKIPEAWRLAHISPVFKKGNRSAPGNYRPISLTSIPCKIMERIVRDIMMDHLYTSNTIAPEQHGFVLRKSVVTNLLQTADRISDGLDKGLHVLVFYLDFAKAFDRVCHASLRTKLIACGFCSSIVNWVSDFISDRQQRVVIGQHKANWVDVTSGVP